MLERCTGRWRSRGKMPSDSRRLDAEMRLRRLPGAPLIGRMSCGQADKATMQSISARKRT